LEAFNFGAKQDVNVSTDYMPGEYDAKSKEGGGPGLERSSILTIKARSHGHFFYGDTEIRTLLKDFGRSHVPLSCSPQVPNP